MREFGHTRAKITGWNFAGFNPTSDEELEKEVEGLVNLDAEVITLVEVKPFTHRQKLIDGRSVKGCAFHCGMLPQASDLDIMSSLTPTA